MQQLDMIRIVEFPRRGEQGRPRAVQSTGESMSLGRLAKRAFDLSITGIVLLLSFPILLLIALAIKLDSPGPIIFKQVRVGRGGKPFTMYKFRSMHLNAEQLIHRLREETGAKDPTFKLVRDPRITRVGYWLRKLSLDELPQLLNVLRSEMSIVGPRPAVPFEVEMYEEWQRARLQGTPGLTGLWQVSGRSRLSFQEMVRLDIHYLEQWSFWLDVVIVLRTIPAVLLSRGAM